MNCPFTTGASLRSFAYLILDVQLKHFCLWGLISGHQNEVKTEVIPNYSFNAQFPSRASLLVFFFFFFFFSTDSTDVQWTDNTEEKCKYSQCKYPLLSFNRLMQSEQKGGDLLSIEDRTPPQGLLSLENKSCEIFVIHPPRFYFGKGADTSALWSNSVPCLPATLYNRQRHFSQSELESAGERSSL